MNKSLVTNVVALVAVIVGLLLEGPVRPLVLNTGLFALSGAVTNWLAVHMLFERVPGFYGSGVIPARFEEFKLGIKTLVMEQFFKPAYVTGFIQHLQDDGDQATGVERMIAAVDLDSAFEQLVDVIEKSSFGNMLGMFGGRDALTPLRDPFIERMRNVLREVARDSEVQDEFRRVSSDLLSQRVENIVDRRLQELTPDLVKEIVQRMIRRHLGWLVVWGGVLGGLIGLSVTVLIS